ncbi:hypothetical protein Bpfe_000620 [Biomphalaria pfeifferi]|uniref:Uncharacterized protein n=1 Tax=Biomphalaria pfeifferi TaxID=112525 RepID=A0AAD8CBR6_BIOPF|nr:hypothetical protein Bpfe_000620 [Biomphalaria pfeifferi]
MNLFTASYPPHLAVMLFQHRSCPDMPLPTYQTLAHRSVTKGRGLGFPYFPAKLGQRVVTRAMPVERNSQTTPWNLVLLFISRKTFLQF